MSHLDTIRAKDVRRRVLLVLRATQGGGYEGWLSDRAILNFLAQDFGDLLFREVQEARTYLAGKGYVADRERRASKFEPGEFDARILPHGVDLLEETIPPDPGVEDNRQ
jgi:hypothetical protein